MIGNNLLALLFDVLAFAFEGLEIIGLPLDLIQPLATISVYGVWIVGADLLAIFATMIVTWWMIKFTVGLVVWLWELLPLT